MVQELRVIDIAPAAISRDRIAVNKEEMEELIASIRAHGLRLPIEVFESDPDPRTKKLQNGLISGWRRLMAMRSLMVEARGDAYTTIKAIVRPRGSAADAYVSIVEENEIRSNLSQYESARIAVLAAGQGTFGSAEEAANALFHSGSKAKRSKILALAELHKELGDMLTHSDKLSKKQGLRIVNANRAGLSEHLPDALAAGQAMDVDCDAASEWALMEPIIVKSEALNKPDKAPGRPRHSPPRRTEEGDTYLRLANGITMMRYRDSRSHYFRLEGRVVNDELIDIVMVEMRRLLEPI